MTSVCFVTSTRADYGIQQNLIRLFKNDKEIDTHIIVTGTHLLKKFGNTLDEIKKDGFRISKKINILDYKNSDKPKSIINTTSLAVKKLGNALSQLKPSIVILLGDRYEIFATAIAASFLKIPICHFHGGEITIGVIDEFIRHSITKMSSLHFTANREYQKRVIQLGEHPKSVFCVGGMGIDLISNTKTITRNKLKKILKIDNFRSKIFVITFHPVTLENNTSKIHFNNILNAINTFQDTTFIFTYPGADMYGNIIINLINKFVANSKNAFAFKSLGRRNYFSLLKTANLVIGNSSSGITEVPYFKIPTINVGERQNGRTMAKSIINVPPIKSKIIKAIKFSETNKFQSICKSVKGTYGKPGASKKSFRIIKRNLRNIKVKKNFYDINFKEN